MKRLEQKAIEEKRIKLCYFLSVLKQGKNIDELEKIIIDSNDAYYNYLYARDVNNANIDIHSKIVLESKNPEYNYYFGVGVNGSNTSLHEQAVVDSGNLEYNLRFALFNDGIKSIDKQEEVILNSKDPYYNYLFAKLINNANIKAHLNILEENRKYNLCKARLKTKVNKK